MKEEVAGLDILGQQFLFAQNIFFHSLRFGVDIMSPLVNSAILM